MNIKQFVDAEVSLFSGPVGVIASAGSSSQTFTYNPTGSGNQWGNFSFNFTATSASTPITIVGTTSGGGQYIGLDNVSVDPVVSSVPELSEVLGTLLSGAIIAGCQLKRRSKSLPI